MIGTIRKHSKWMWVIIIAATVISFVYWGSQSSPTGGPTGKPNFGSIEGEPVTMEDYVNAQHEVYLRYFFNYGEWPDRDAKRMGFDAERESYYRLLLIQKQKELNVHVSSEAVAQVASDILRSFGRGNPVPFDAFVKQVLQPHGLSAQDFERFIRHDLGIQELIAAAGLGGKLVTPQEVRALYEREHEELSVEAVFFSGSNYLTSITVTPEAVAQFFTNQMARYRLPERVQVSYVSFPASNFLAEAVQEISKITNLTERLEAVYQQRGTNFYPEAKPEEAKEKILKEEQHRQALLLARKKANEFATALFAMEPARVQNLEPLAKTNGLTVNLSAPFDREDGPKDFDVGPDFAKAAFSRTDEEPFAGPLVGEEAVYVIARHSRLPSEVPPLDKIRDQVTTDYQYSQAVQLARKAGEDLASAMTGTNGLAQGRKFSEICAQTGAHPVLLPPFSLSTRELRQVENHVSLGVFKQAAFSAALGRPSGFVPTAEGGFVVSVQSRLPLDETKMRADLPAFTASVRQARQSEAFNDWFRKAAERGLRDTPVFRPQQPSLTGAPGK